MTAICDEFRTKMPLDAQRLLRAPYIPSCIRGTAQPFAGACPIEMVWQLDYSIVDAPASEPFIQLRPFAQGQKRAILKFQIEDKDGRVFRCSPKSLKPVWIEGPPIKKEEVVMTDGCSLISIGVSSYLLLPLSSPR